MITPGPFNVPSTVSMVARAFCFAASAAFDDELITTGGPAAAEGTAATAVEATAASLSRFILKLALRSSACLLLRSSLASFSGSGAVAPELFVAADAVLTPPVDSFRRAASFASYLTHAGGRG